MPITRTENTEESGQEVLEKSQNCPGNPWLSDKTKCETMGNVTNEPELLAFS